MGVSVPSTPVGEVGRTNTTMAIASPFPVDFDEFLFGSTLSEMLDCRRHCARKFSSAAGSFSGPGPAVGLIADTGTSVVLAEGAECCYVASLAVNICGWSSTLSPRGTGWAVVEFELDTLSVGGLVVKASGHSQSNFPKLRPLKADCNRRRWIIGFPSLE